MSEKIMSKKITPDMLNDEGIRSALELLQEQVSRYTMNNKRSKFILGENTSSHLLPKYYIREFKKLSKKIQSRQYNILLASISLMLHLPELTQLSLVKNAELQFKILRDSTPETLDINQLDRLIKQVESIALNVKEINEDAC